MFFDDQKSERERVGKKDWKWGRGVGFVLRESEGGGRQGECEWV